MGVWQSDRGETVDTPFAHGFSSAEGLPTNSDWWGMARSVEGVERWEVILSVHETDPSLWTARSCNLRLDRQAKLCLIPVHFKDLVVYSPR